jgi:hypothetical protein
MHRHLRYLLPLAFLLLLATTWAFAQEEEVNQYVGAFQIGRYIIGTLIWSAIYLVAYTVVLVLTLSYFRLFSEFDTDMLIWIGVLWIGGLVINGVAYHLGHSQFVSSLIALPLIFGWSTLIATRPFADLTWSDAAKISLVIALVCAPYFGPTLYLPPKAPAESSQRPARVMVVSNVVFVNIHEYSGWLRNIYFPSSVVSKSIQEYGIWRYIARGVQCHAAITCRYGAVL